MLGRDKAKLGLGLPPRGAALAGSPTGSEGSCGNLGHIVMMHSHQIFQNDPDNCFNDFMTCHTDAPVGRIRDTLSRQGLRCSVLCQECEIMYPSSVQILFSQVMLSIDDHAVDTLSSHAKLSLRYFLGSCYRR